MISNKLSQSSKGTKIAAAIIGTFFFVMFNDSFITHNYLSNSPISSNWITIERYLLAILSSILFIRGLYGFKKDKENSKTIGKIYFGYHWDSKDIVQLQVDTTHQPDESDKKILEKARGKLIKYITTFMVVLSGIAAFEMITGFYLNGGRTNISQNILQFNGVTAWGDSQAVFTMIALFELIVQSIFVLIFLRGVIGFYHDYLVSRKNNEFIVFENVKAPYLDKLDQTIKAKLSKKQEK